MTTSNARRLSIGLLAMLLLGIAFIAGLYCGGRSPVARDYAPPMPVVGMPLNASDRQFAAAGKICEKFFPYSTPHKSDRNPVCCVWIEIVRSLPAGSGDGYIISHSGNATAISATSPDALDHAVDAFVASAKTINGRVMAPTGILTSYPVRRQSQ